MAAARVTTVRASALGSLLVLVVSACSATTDIVAYERVAVGTVTDGGLNAVADAQTAQLTVIGTRANGWRFEFAEWPLEPNLQAFFSSPSDGREVRVVVSGDEALVLQQLRDDHVGDEYGPTSGPLGVRDRDGNEFTIVLLPSNRNN